MKLNNDMSKAQIRAYDKTLAEIREHFGSYHSIALRIYTNCGREVTGETVRAWFTDRRVPTHIAFVLFEVMEKAINPLHLCPWLAEHVQLTWD